MPHTFLHSTDGRIPKPPLRRWRRQHDSLRLRWRQLRDPTARSVWNRSTVECRALGSGASIISILCVPMRGVQPGCGTMQSRAAPSAAEKEHCHLCQIQSQARQQNQYRLGHQCTRKKLMISAHLSRDRNREHPWTRLSKHLHPITVSLGGQHQKQRTMPLRNWPMAGCL